MKDVVIGKETATFNFTFESSGDVSESFKNGTYDSKYNAKLVIRNDDMKIYDSEKFEVNVGEGNDPFQYIAEDKNVSALYNTTQIIYITLELYDDEDMLFCEYSFVGAADGFIKG